MDIENDSRMQRINDNSSMQHFYIHIPFCRQKCNYCAFYSIPTDGYSLRKFCDAIMREISIYKCRFPDDSVPDDATIFIGGGTPSLLTEKQIGKIVRSIEIAFDINEDSEITMEGNPESLSKDKLKILRDYDVNRISIGVQSLHDKHLSFLGRIHDESQAFKAIISAIDVGFEKINADLIYGIPGMMFGELIDDIKQLIEMGVSHISLYSLGAESGTPLDDKVRGGFVRMPGQDEIAEQYYAAADFLRSSGFYAYEVSNFALPGQECKHNMAYWNGDSYIGFGPAAHSFDSNRRWNNVSSVDEYMRKVLSGCAPIDFKEILSARERFEETVMLGLRLENGFSITIARQFLSNVVAEKITQITKPMIDKGILVARNDNIALGNDYRLMADGVAAAIINGVPI